MPPGIVSTAPTHKKPTTIKVRPGMMMKSGHPLSVRSTPDRTISSANRPITTSTMPSAVLDPPRRAGAGCALALTNGGGAGVLGDSVGGGSGSRGVSMVLASGGSGSGGSAGVGSSTGSATNPGASPASPLVAPDVPRLPGNQ